MMKIRAEKKKCKARLFVDDEPKDSFHLKLRKETEAKIKTVQKSKN